MRIEMIIAAAIFFATTQLTLGSDARAQENKVLAEEEVREIKRNFPKEMWDVMVSALSKKRALESMVAKHPESVGPKLVELMAAMKAATSSQEGFAQAQRDFEEVVDELKKQSFILEPRYANALADDYIDLYLGRKELFPLGGHFVAAFIARFPNSQKAKQLLTETLLGRGPAPEFKEHFLINLYWGSGFRNDAEVFDALGKVFSQDPQAWVALGDMHKIDPERARPVIMGVIDKSTTVLVLNKIAGVVSATKDPALIMHYATKVDGFPPSPVQESDPARGLYDGAMACVISSASGESLLAALSFIRRRLPPGPSDRSALLKKLADGVAASDRRAVADAVAGMAKDRKLNARGWRDKLIPIEAKEMDSEVRKSLRQALVELSE